jgi:hypothetical protein
MNTYGTIGVGTYSSDSSAIGITGSIYYNTSSSALKVYSGSAWSSIGSGTSLAGVTAVGVTASNGATLTTDSYLQLVAAGATYPGIVTLASQTFAGSKTFSSDITVNSITVGLGGGSISTNTAVGLNALGNNSTGTYSIGIGPNALYNNVGIGNIAIGLFSQDVANSGSSHNYSIGYECLRNNTSGSSNIVFGYQNSIRNTTGSNNTAIGTSSFSYNTTGSYNTVLGSDALITNVGGTYNVGVGYKSDVGSANLYNVVAIGASAVGYTSNTIQMGNSNITQMNTYGTIGVGTYSSDSSALGITGSIYYNTSSSALKVYSGSAWSSIGSGTSLTGVTAVTSSEFANGATLTTDNYLQLGPASASNPGILTTGSQTIGGSKTFNSIMIGTTGTFSNTVTAAAFNSTSDYRVKENIQNLNLNIYNVNPLRPVNYYNNKLNKLDIGFIAHEVQEYYPFLVSGEKDGEENQSLNYSGIIGILVKEIQDLKQRVKQLEDDSKNK